MEYLGRIKECYFSYEGRLNRKIYIIRILITLMIIHFTSLINSTQASVSFDNIIGAVIIIACSISIMMLSIRRAHDLNKKWPWALLIFIPGGILYLFIAAGSPTVNEYGSIPLD
jgi:uncharacterized membrane protein YhaH (DUF805 family)